MNSTPITVAYGNGIGPEIMQATLDILKASGAKISIEKIEIGEEVYKKGISAGIEDSSWESLKRTKVFLKAPITTPQGGGFKSLNVTVRKTLGLYANVRPCVSYHPFVATKHPTMDVVIIRENEEDVYAGIEYRLSDEVAECLKLISEPGSEKIVRFAFEYAKNNSRKKVSCFSKDNIMKITDGLFHKTFDRIAKEYPDIQSDHYIVDIGMARVANNPERFDVIVTENLYGDILSDIAAEVAGSVGLAGTANIGPDIAMFEAIHGSAPDIAGQNIANPSGLLLSAVMMLVHIGQSAVAENIHNAWLAVLEDGLHTKDIYTEGRSKKLLGTKEFAESVISYLGKKPKGLKPVSYAALAQDPKKLEVSKVKESIKKRVGVDFYITDLSKNTANISKSTQSAAKKAGLKLSLITNRGVKVWPDGSPETYCSDLYRCRFMAENNSELDYQRLAQLQAAIVAEGLHFCKLEMLQEFDGIKGYSAGQGE